MHRQKKLAILLTVLLCFLSFVSCGTRADDTNLQIAEDVTGHTTTDDQNPSTPTLLHNEEYPSLDTNDPTRHTGGSNSNDQPIRTAASTTTSGVRKSSTKATTKTTTTTTSTSSSKTRPAIRMNRETQKDGLVLQVQTAYQHQFAGESFTVTTSITNTTQRDITYRLPSSTPNMHLEIQVSIRGQNNVEFIDMDTYGKAKTDENKYVVLKAGETYSQTIRFLPGSASGGYWADLSSQTISWYPAGEYKGTAIFTWVSGTADNPGETKQLQLEFPVELV